MLSPASSGIVNIHTLADQEVERNKLRSMLQKFLDWDAEWPKSAAVMDETEIAQAELALDDLMVETRAML